MPFGNATQDGKVPVKCCFRSAISLVPHQALPSAGAAVGFSLPERSERVNVSAFFGLAADLSLFPLGEIYGRSR
jgi:hypothetical protein